MSDPNLSPQMPPTGSSFGLSQPIPPQVHQDVPPQIPSAPETESPLMTAAAAQAEQDALIAAAKPPAFKQMPWRIADRNRFRTLLMRLMTLVDENGQLALAAELGDAANVTHLDLDQIGKIEAVNDVFERADDALRAVALDPAAYERWSANLADPEKVIGALLVKYGRAVGELTGSANG
jgi:hypothetical protein